jgi:hypothetical protein
MSLYMCTYTFMIRYYIILYYIIVIYLTVIGLTPGDSSTHLHTNNTQNNTIDTKQYIEQQNSLIRKCAGRAPSLRGIPWHLLYN